MTDSAARILEVIEAAPKASGMRVGRVVSVGRQAVVLVDYPGNRHGALRAKVVGSLSLAVLRRAAKTGQGVLLGFADGDAMRPVVLDTVRDGHATARHHARGSVLMPIPTRPHPPTESGAPPFRVVRLAGVRDGVAHVHLEEDASPTAARTAIRLRNLEDAVVVLVPATGDPVIIAQLYPVAEMELPGSPDCDVSLRGRRVHIEAETELVLTSGRVRLQLDARGKATTTADTIVSRARGANKVQGGSVHLN